ncbi:MAG TPA: thioredoxin [Sedimentibacter sp.]|jgi:thioredoxin 1|nr:thioredoxin [Sedimentibacter sp.]NLA14191.1 thioredoxin [Tissierellia bacterium]HOA19484.1 thioredoxin [Sedimentibacter sp.]HOG61935.1 thioredoxin [Sedimentibacter sp.]HOT21675.1 thioredoxin [Sedimentibacter sp.]
MNTVKITSDNFEQEVLKSDKPVLLDFWAAWCGPCKMISPIIEEIAKEVTDAKIGKVNIDEQPELASAFGIMSIPTLVKIKDGKVVNKMIGVRPKASIVQMLAS